MCDLHNFDIVKAVVHTLLLIDHFGFNRHHEKPIFKTRINTKIGFIPSDQPTDKSTRRADRLKGNFTSKNVVKDQILNITKQAIIVNFIILHL